MKVDKNRADDPESSYTRTEHSNQDRREEQRQQEEEAVNRVRLEASRHFIDMYKLLGSGAFADVRPGTYTFSGQRRECVAYKIIKNGQFLSPSMKRQIEKEVALGIQLNHPNVIKIYGVVEVPRLGPALVLELAHRSLRAVLDDTSVNVSWKTGMKWLFDVACGMCELHSLLPRKIIHRDLKAANVLLNQDMTLAKITDFGVATTIDTFRSTLSVSGGAAGTMSFKAPESFAGEYSEATDVYAFGITIYEVCTRLLARSRIPKSSIAPGNASSTMRWPSRKMASTKPSSANDGTRDTLSVGAVRISAKCGQAAPRLSLIG